MAHLHVCIVNTSSHVFGAERSIAGLVGKIAGDSLRYTFLTPEGAAARLFDALPHSEVRALPLERLTRNQRPDLLIHQGIQWFRGSLRVHRALRSPRPDVVHANGLQSLLYALLPCRFLRIPLLWHVRDNFRSTLAMRLCASRVAAVAVPSRYLEQRARTLGRKVLLAANPIAPSGGAPENAAMWTWPGLTHTFRIGLIGQMIPRKGHRILLDALPTVREAIPRAEVVLIGNDPFSPDSEYALDIQRRVQETKGVFHTDYIEAVDTAYTVLDAVAIPSLDEPFGRVALEAMRAGCPVVAARVGGLPETIRHGENGLLFKPNDVGGLARALIEVASSSDLRERLARNGLETYQEHEASATDGAWRIAATYRELAGIS